MKKNITHIDSLIINSAIFYGYEKQNDDLKVLVDYIKVNFLGIAILIESLIKQYSGNKIKQIICLASIAGIRGRSKNYFYGSSKNSLIHFLEGLRMKHFPNIKVSTVLPGNVSSDSAKKYTNTYLSTSTENAADRIIKLIFKHKDYCYIPKKWFIISLIIRIIPNFIYKRLKF